MRLITNSELSRRTEGELAELFCRVSKALAQTRRGSPERRDALASLENINRERAKRHGGPKP